MKAKVFALGLCLFLVELAKAQIPVIDASNLAQLITMVRRVQEQVQLTRQQVGVIQTIRSISDTQLRTIIDSYEFAKLQARGFSQGTLKDIAAHLAIESIRRATLEKTGVLPITHKDVVRYYYSVSDMVRSGDVAGAMNISLMALEEISRSVHAMLGALEAHQQQLVTSSTDVDRISMAMRNANLTAQQQRQLQTQATALAARETMLLREATNVQTYLNYLEMQQRDFELAQQRALQQRLLNGVQAPNTNRRP